MGEGEKEGVQKHLFGKIKNQITQKLHAAKYGRIT